MTPFRFLPLFLLALLLLSGRALADTTNVLVAYDRTEPAVATDPHHRSTVVVVTNTNYDAPVAGTYPVGFFASHNGGRSFQAGNAPVLAPWTTQADPSVAINNRGTVFFTYLAESPTFCSEAGGSAIILARSFDHGRSFSSPSLVDRNPSDDKPFEAVESKRTGLAHVFVSWTRQEGNRDGIWLARSTNGGATFGPPTRLYLSLNNGFGSVPAVGKHGWVYVAWSSYPDRAYTEDGTATMLIRASADDGQHFGPVRAVSKPFPTLPLMALPGDLRNQTTPSLAVAPNGTLYLAWSQLGKQLANGAAEANIMLSRSTTHGRTWSTPRVVNDARVGDRFMPTISVLPGGSVGIAFYDRRNGPGELDLYAARVSFQGGFHRSPNVRVTQGSAPVSDIYYMAPGHSSCFYPGRFFGDYIGSAPGVDGALDVSWADTQAHVYRRTDIRFAAVKFPSATRR